MRSCIHVHIFSPLNRRSAPWDISEWLAKLITICNIYIAWLTVSLFADYFWATKGQWCSFVLGIVTLFLRCIPRFIYLWPRNNKSNAAHLRRDMTPFGGGGCSSPNFMFGSSGWAIRTSCRGQSELRQTLNIPSSECIKHLPDLNWTNRDSFGFLCPSVCWIRGLCHCVCFT